MPPRSRNGRAAILASAARLFTEVGYHGTSIRDIAADASVTVPSIYYHFTSKQQILQQIMASALDEVYAETAAAVQTAGDDPVRQLVSLVRHWILFHIRRPEPAIVGASEIRSLDESGYAEVIELRDRQEALFHSVVDRGLEAGVFATPHPEEAARAIIAMGRSIVSWYQAGGQLQPDDLADRYAELTLAMVRSQAP